MSELRRQLHFTNSDLMATDHEDQYISRFGSHFSLRFSPDGRGLLPVGLGPIHTDHPVFLGVEHDGQMWTLPLQYPAVFEKAVRTILDYDRTRTMTSLTLVSNEDHGGLDISWEFVSPFYPQDHTLCSAPFFYITARITNAGATRRTVTVLGGLEDSEETHGDEASLATAHVIRQRINVAATFRGPETKSGKLLRYALGLGSLSSSSLRQVETSCARWQCVSQSHSLAPGESRDYGFLLTSFLLDPGIVSYHGKPCDFYYQSVFASERDVFHYAQTERNQILARTALFDDLFTRCSIPQHIKDFIFWNFHIFLGSTWLLQHPDGRVFYTNYEGGAAYFSTIDVEYNLGIFYGMFWPQLLADQLQLWADVYQRGNRFRPHRFGPHHRIMEHDVGGGFVMDEQMYIPGPMPVEENSNFLLLHYLYYRYTGDTSLFCRHRTLCGELADYIVEADTNGNGMPNIGTNNTLDCFAPVLRDMPDQVFLSIKAQTALGCLCIMQQEIMGTQEGLAGYWAHVRLIRRTLDEQAWLDDHYVLTISPTRPDGWERPCPLTTNGLAYLLFTGSPLLLSQDRLRTDLQRTVNEYTLWPSMGVWRDMVGLYWGITLARHIPFDRIFGEICILDHSMR